jgi:phage shock protein A
MSLEFAAQLANFAADELVSTRKELRCVNSRYEKLYNDHENLKYDHENLQQEHDKLKYDHENLQQAMLEMEKKMSALLATHKEQSAEQILREFEEEWSKPARDYDKIQMLNEKYDAICRV